MEADSRLRKRGGDEFYHLSVDPEESTNLIRDPKVQAIVTDLDVRLRARMKAIDYQKSSYE